MKERNKPLKSKSLEESKAGLSLENKTASLGTWKRMSRSTVQAYKGQEVRTSFIYLKYRISIVIKRGFPLTAA